jgi:sugar phosphate isomerase/epimerase
MSGPIRVIQQIQVGTVTGSEAQARKTLRLLVEAGYEGIELNGFMIRPTSRLVRALTRAYGMPVGAGGAWTGRPLSS